jgi:hypothetical protein
LGWQKLLGWRLKPSVGLLVINGASETAGVALSA